ncbi:Diguanylate cyclase [Altererythrobacter insulae]|nr:Diguanylate cyclase [Altererythrobacter insulae]
MALTGLREMFANRRQAAEAARKAQMLDSFEAAGLGYFWSTDAHGNLEYLTPAAFGNLGWNRKAVTGSPLSNHLLPAEDPDKASERPLSYLLSARNAITGLTVKLKTDIGDVWWEISGKPQFDVAGEFTGYRGSAKDITHDRAQMMRDGGDRRAQLDSLTGLPNKTQIKRTLTHTLRVFRNTKQSCAVLMVDLDRFKQVNETLGQAAGNELLKQAAARLSRVGDKKATVARLSADEFIILIPDVDDRGILGDFGQRFVQTLSQPYVIDGNQANVGASVGIAVAPYDGVETDELINAAEMALYAAKGSGKGKYRFYSSDLKTQARHRGEIENELREAIGKDELRMFYQPIIDAKTHEVRCVEALIRWEHPERGWISPGEFIPIAEESGVIRKVGAWALSQVCKDASEWPVEIRAAINVSAVQFDHDDFVQIAKKTIKDTGIDPSRIELEITESVFIGDYDGIMKIFKGLKGLGVRLSLDDFGTGYSSLSYLRNAPFDKIKIDQSFVRGCTEPGNNNSAIIRAIVSLAEALNMETVAEGIEAMDELDLVKQRGATHLQGLIFSGAISNDDLLSKLNSGELRYEPRGPEKYRADRRTEFRRIHLIHDDHRYDVVLRNLSKTGALVEGLLNVPQETEVVLDLGGGQLAVATVRRSSDYTQGLEFETPLISDGADGLCTRHRVSPYQIEAAGQPLAALPDDPYAAMSDAGASKARPAAFSQVDLRRRENAA